MDNRKIKDEGKLQPNEPVKDLRSRSKKNLRRSLSKSKRAKYNSASLSAGQALRDLKNTASRHISSVKNTLDSLISQKLRITSPKNGSKKTCLSGDKILYDEFENEPRTPIKLYSPFGIETPSPHKAKLISKKRNPKPFQSRINQAIAFSSPTGKIKDDVRSITHSLNQLSLINTRIQTRCSAQNVTENKQSTVDELLMF